MIEKTVLNPNRFLEVEPFNLLECSNCDEAVKCNWTTTVNIRVGRYICTECYLDIYWGNHP